MERIDKEIIITEYMISKNDKFIFELRYVTNETLDELIKIISLEVKESKGNDTFIPNKLELSSETL